MTGNKKVTALPLLVSASANAPPTGVLCTRSLSHLITVFSQKSKRGERPGLPNLHPVWPDRRIKRRRKLCARASCVATPIYQEGREGSIIDGLATIHRGRVTHKSRRLDDAVGREGLEIQTIGWPRRKLHSEKIHKVPGSSPHARAAAAAAGGPVWLS